MTVSTYTVEEVTGRGSGMALSEMEAPFFVFGCTRSRVKKEWTDHRKYGKLTSLLRGAHVLLRKYLVNHKIRRMLSCQWR